MLSRISALAVACFLTLAAAAQPLPVRGIHFSAPPRDQLTTCLQFIREALPKEGVNTMVLEINYGYAFQSHPELASPGALNREDILAIVQACRDAKIELIPQFNCLGHQSWDSHTFALLTKYPEFDETPGKYPGNKDIYCRSWCPRHPEVHKVVFALMDELAEAFEAKAFHVGMDEVFLLGDPDCPRCGGMETAQLFADEVNLLHSHLAAKGLKMWMWGDRFINGKATGIGEWEASTNGTEPAIRSVPRSLVICDWHYERADPTAVLFAAQGLQVLSCPWRKSEVALGQLELIRHVKKNAAPLLASRLRGVLHTTWCGMVPFINAYYEKGTPDEAAKETAQCFKDLFAAIRSETAAVEEPEHEDVTPEE